MKRSVKISLILLGAAVVVAMVVAANLWRSGMQVRGIDVVIRYGHSPELVGQQEVRDTVLAVLPNLLRQQVKAVDCQAVAAAAARVPYLTGVDATVSVSGRVVVRAAQRRPIARIFYGEQELYIDRYGHLFPASNLGNCEVLVAGGDFVRPLHRLDTLYSQTHSLWRVASFLDDEPDYALLVGQLFVERDGDILIVPRIGGQIVELGSPENLEEKFSNLLTFYRKGMPRAGWDTYSKISLKYRGQVVCTKK